MARDTRRATASVRCRYSRTAQAPGTSSPEPFFVGRDVGRGDSLVRNAAGPTREELQWQKFEDTSTGYWLTYAPFKIEYMNVGRWVHDMACHPNGAHKARGGGLYRPPSNATLLVHNLKNGGFHYAAELMAHGSDSYDHRSCMDDIGSVRRANRLDAKNGVGVRGQAASAKVSSFLLRRGAVRSVLAGGSMRHGGNAKRLGR